MWRRVADDEGGVFRPLLKSDFEGSSLKFFGRDSAALDSYAWEGSVPEDDAAPCVLICARAASIVKGVLCHNDQTTSHEVWND